MHLGHLELPVTDPLASARFYTEVLGFRLVANQGGRFVWVALGDAEILLRPGHPRPGTEDDAAGLVLYSDDVEADRARLEAGGLAIETRGSCHHFRDPDGHPFQLVDPTADHSA